VSLYAKLINFRTIKVAYYSTTNNFLTIYGGYIHRSSK